MFLRINLLSFFMLWVASQSISAQVLSKPISKQLTYSNEPSIAVDPYDGRVLIGANVDQLYLSVNGGFTFEERKLTSSFGVYGDPVVYIDRLGHYYYAHLSKTKGKKVPEMWDRIVVQRSDDGGDSFLNGIGVGYVEGKMQDKHWLTGDMNTKSPFVNRLYLSWTEFDKYNSKAPEDSSRIKFAYSDNFADSFSEPVIISDTAGDCLDGDNTLEGATIAVGPKGELYCVWAGKSKIFMDISLDGGKTWGKDRVIANQIGGWDQEVPFLSRANSMPFVICDKKGKIIVVFGDRRYGDLDIFAIESEDMGETFGSPVRINQDPVGNGRDQFMPNIAYDRVKNCFYIAYYTRERSQLNLFTEVNITTGSKLNKLKTSTITEMPFAPPSKFLPKNKSFFGDYLDVDALGGAIGVVWAEVDPNTNQIVVKTTLGDHKSYQKHELYLGNQLNEYLVADSGLLYLNYTIGENKGYKIEVSRYGKTVYQRNEIDPISPGTYEEKLRIKFVSGTYEIKLTYKGQSFSKNFTIN